MIINQNYNITLGSRVILILILFRLFHLFLIILSFFNSVLILNKKFKFLRHALWETLI